MSIICSSLILEIKTLFILLQYLLFDPTDTKKLVIAITCSYYYTKLLPTTTFSSR